MTSASPIGDKSLASVFIVILTWKTKEITLTCLQNLRLITYPNAHIIIVDNASMDDTITSIQQQFPETTILVNRSNLGFAGGSNVGIRYALDKGADFILLLNNDTLVPSNLLEILLNQTQLSPNTGIVMPVITEAGDSQELWFAGSRRHWLMLDVADFSPYVARHKPANYPQKVDFVFGTAMLVSRKVFEKIGLLDESFFLYYEDMDFCQRAREAGFEIYVVPEVTVQHHISASTDGLLSMRYYHKARSGMLYYKKYTKGIRWLLIIPYRIASTMRTIIHLLRQHHVNLVNSFLRGLFDGIRSNVINNDLTGREKHYETNQIH